MESVLIHEVEVKPRSVYCLLQIELETDTTQSAQGAVALALIRHAAQLLGGAAPPSGKHILDPYGPTSGHFTWSVNIRDGSP